MTPIRAIHRQLVRYLLFLVIGSLGVHARAAGGAGVTQEVFGGREMLVYLPPQLAAPGQRALVIVLHGGLGNAQRIESEQSESGLRMDALAQANGFVVAYLNGTPAARLFGADKLAWNAGGGCCGLAAQASVDDVSYIRNAARHLAAEYGVDHERVFAIGHSNGAMMAQLMLCETDAFAAIVAISGPLNIDGDSCPGARGRRVLALHGALDQNVPIAGGVGARGLSRVAYKSEERSQQVLRAAGADYQLQVVSGADHTLANLESAIEQGEHITIAEKAARFFGITRVGPS